MPTEWIIAEQQARERQTKAAIRVLFSIRFRETQRKLDRAERRRLLRQAAAANLVMGLAGVGALTGFTAAVEMPLWGTFLVGLLLGSVLFQIRVTLKELKGETI